MEEDLPTLPTLPLEIWRYIFWLTIYDPRVPDLSFKVTSPNVPSYPEPPAVQEQQIDQALESKASYSLVCRAWRAASLGFLFEHISLVFEQSEKYKLSHGVVPSSFKGDAGILRHVRSVRVVYQSGRVKRTLKTYQAGFAFLRLCSHLSALELHLDFYPPELIETAIESCGTSLRYLKIHRYVRRWLLPPEALTSTALPNLEWLELRQTPMFHDLEHPIINLPSLHTLMLDLPLPAEQIWDVPHLRRLDLPILSPDELIALTHIFPEPIRAGVKMMYYRPTRSPLRELGTLFPNVEILRLQIPDKISLWTTPHGQFPRVHEIGLTLEPPLWDVFAGEQHDPDVYNHAMRIEATFRAMGDRTLFPVLKVVRCCNFELPREQYWWEEVATVLLANGIEILNGKGELTPLLVEG